MTRGRLQVAWRATARAVVAIRALDPDAVQAALERMGGQKRWLAPLAYAAGTLTVVFDGVLVLLRNLRLLLLQAVPAAWILIMTRELTNRLFSDRDVSVEYSGLLALAVILVTQIAYWCNATFAFVLASEDGSMADAFGQARRRRRLVTGTALITGTAHASVWIWFSQLGNTWLTVGLTIMWVVQIYMFVALPSWLIGAAPLEESRRERITRTLTTGALSGVVATPGFILNRIGLLLLGLPGIGFIKFIGFLLLAVGTAIHVAGSSSVRVVKLSIRLRGPDGEEARSSPGAPGAPAASRVEDADTDGADCSPRE